MAERNALMPYWQGAKMTANHLFRGAMENDVVERPTMFPFAKYSDGAVRPALPGLIAAPFEGFNAMWERGDEANVLNPEALDQSSRESFDAAGLAATGGLAAGAMGAGERAAIGATDSVLPSRYADIALDVQGPPARYGSGHYRLEAPPLHPAMSRLYGESRDFGILRGDENIGHIKAAIDYDGNRALVDTINTHDGSNSIGLSGIRDLREAFRDFAPEVNHFTGDRAYAMKTGAAGDARAALGGYGRSQDVDFYSGGYGLGQMIRDMFSSPDSGAMGAVPEGAVAANGIGRAVSHLPMDDVSRLSRARDMGFDTDKVWYHGTGVDNLDSFDPLMSGSQNGGPHPSATVFSSDEGRAGYYRDRASRHTGQNGQLLRTFVRGKQTILDASDPTVAENIRAQIAAARDSGSDSVILRNHMDEPLPDGTYPDELYVFDPRNIRRTDADFDPAKSDSSNLLYSNSPSSASVPLAVNAMEKKGIRAYHGSPHDFDKFDMSKIGTGEGAQSYGHGLYFAEEEAVAKAYRDALSDGDYTFGGQPTDNNNWQHHASWALREAGDDRAMAREMLDDVYPDTPEMQNALAEAGRYVSDPQSDLAALPKIDQRGHMYEVNINTDPERFIDWDAPFSQQHETVRSFFENTLRNEQSKDVGVYNSGFMKWFAGSPEVGALGPYRTKAQAQAAADRNLSRYRNTVENETAMKQFINATPENSAKMRDAGIPGIRYYDQMSRHGKDGTRNYVLFDDSLVDINRKYANHPLGSSAPLAFNDYEDQPQGLFARRPRPGLFQ